jgi:glutaminyl-peptide cyclotransferase
MVTWRVILLLLLCCTRPEPASLEVGFDGQRAFRELLDLVDIGPRPAGSPGAERARGLIRERLRQAGWRVESHVFRAGLPGEPEVEMTNLIGIRVGERPNARVLLGTHYDTKRVDGIRFVGANDGASGVALLLELARQLGARPLPFTVWLVFFDGEEAFGERIDSEDGLYGSRALAQRMAAEGTLESIRSFVLVDMVADRDLNLAVDLGSSPALRAVLREEAERLDMAGLIDPKATLRVVDDHTPFAERGVREVLAVIDFQFGARRSPGPLWHTLGDGPDAVSQESLNSVGRLVVQVLNRIEKRLLERAPAP